MKTLLIFATCLLVLLPYATNGQTWTSLNSPSGYFKNVRSLTSDNGGGSGSSVVAYAADESNLMKSTDAGGNWASTITPQAGVRAVVCRYDNSSVVVVSGGTGSSLFQRSEERRVGKECRL